MLRAVVHRVSPGRPEAQLATVDVVPLQRTGRFSCHVTAGDGRADARIDQHVDVAEWDPTRPAVDLIGHVLNVARAQRELEAEGVQAVVLPAELAAQLAKIALWALDTPSVQGPPFAVDEDFARDVRALMTQALGAGRIG